MRLFDKSSVFDDAGSSTHSIPTLSNSEARLILTCLTVGMLDHFWYELSAGKVLPYSLSQTERDMVESCIQKVTSSMM